jgi:hypothetical protein
MNKTPSPTSYSNDKNAARLTTWILPIAFPGPFESMLSHSIYAKRFETDWQWINRREMVIAPVIRWTLVAGAIGGLINLVRGRDRIINSLAVAVGLLLYYLATHVGL